MTLVEYPSGLTVRSQMVIVVVVATCRNRVACLAQRRKVLLVQAFTCECTPVRSSRLTRNQSWPCVPHLHGLSSHIRTVRNPCQIVSEMSTKSLISRALCNGKTLAFQAKMSEFFNNFLIPFRCGSHFLSVGIPIVHRDYTTDRPRHMVQQPLRHMYRRTDFGV